jgi:glycosyltransferase involved in cell wall biosynthesis
MPMIPSNWVLHDYLQVNGGAERVVTTLARELPNFELAVSGIYADFRGTGELTGAKTLVIGRFTGWLPRIPRALLAFTQNHAFLRSAECVIYSGVYAPLAVANQAIGRKIYYCHTAPRFAFDREDLTVCSFPGFLRPFLRQAISKYRSSYLEAVRSMDVIITNSCHVRERLLRQTGVNAQVIYPPIDTKVFRFLGQEDYYLSVGRLEPKKRVDRIVKAFLNMPDKKLVVASGGSELNKLKALVNQAPNIQFSGWVDRYTLARMIGNAIAVIYVPWDEDFGMSAVEAMAAGKPVIGVDEGGLRESVIDGDTGILLASDPEPQDIVDAILRLPPNVAAEMRSACEQRAQSFSEARFVSAFKKCIP